MKKYTNMIPAFIALLGFIAIPVAYAGGSSSLDTNAANAAIAGIMNQNRDERTGGDLENVFQNTSVWTVSSTASDAPAAPGLQVQSATSEAEESATGETAPAGTESEDGTAGVSADNGMDGAPADDGIHELSLAVRRLCWVQTFCLLILFAGLLAAIYAWPILFDRDEAEEKKLAAIREVIQESLRDSNAGRGGFSAGVENRLRAMEETLHAIQTAQAAAVDEKRDRKDQHEHFESVSAVRNDAGDYVFCPKEFSGNTRFGELKAHLKEWVAAGAPEGYVKVLAASLHLFSQRNLLQKESIKWCLRDISYAISGILSTLNRTPAEIEDELRIWGYFLTMCSGDYLSIKIQVPNIGARYDRDWMTTATDRLEFVQTIRTWYVLIEAGKKRQIARALAEVE